MKAIRLLLAGLAGLSAALVLTAGTTSSKKTYTVIGYYAGAQPSAALLQKAALAVGEKMAGFTQVQDSIEATHTVEIKFKRDSFEIYVDALPLERRPHSAVEKHSLFVRYQQGDLARDYADGK